MKRIFGRLIREWPFWCVAFLALFYVLLKTLSCVKIAKTNGFVRWMNGIEQFDSEYEIDIQIERTQETIDELKDPIEEKDRIEILSERKAILKFIKERGLKYSQLTDGSIGDVMMERTSLSCELLVVVFFVVIIVYAAFLFIINSWGCFNGTCSMEYMIQTREKVFRQELAVYGISISAVCALLILFVSIIRLLLPLHAETLVFCSGERVAAMSAILYYFALMLSLQAHLFLFLGIQFVLVHLIYNKIVVVPVLVIVPIVLAFMVGRINGRLGALLSPFPDNAVVGEISPILYAAIGACKIGLCGIMIAVAYHANNKRAILPNNV